MFNLESEKEIFSNLEDRKSIITNLEKLSKPNELYLSFLTKLKGIEIIPDIVIYGYEDSLNENRYLEKNYSECSSIFWIIGYSGQGDSWFISKSDDSIFFYDRNLGEYQIDYFMNLGINFLELLKLAFLYRDLEIYPDLNDNIDEINQGKFKDVVNLIHDDLFSLYPYAYFQQTLETYFGIGL